MLHETAYSIGAQHADGSPSMYPIRRSCPSTQLVDEGEITMPGRVADKVALVTGGASGIGRATALTFAREGAKLIIADMNEDGGQQTVHMITENGGDATFVQVDVAQTTAVEAMLNKTVETYGRLDCAHNNAYTSRKTSSRLWASSTRSAQRSRSCTVAACNRCSTPSGNGPKRCVSRRRNITISPS
jgi:hypothetical protein